MTAFFEDFARDDHAHGVGIREQRNGFPLAGRGKRVCKPQEACVAVAPVDAVEKIDAFGQMGFIAAEERSQSDDRKGWFVIPNVGDHDAQSGEIFESINFERDKVDIAFVNDALCDGEPYHFLAACMFFGMGDCTPAVHQLADRDRGIRVRVDVDVIF